MKKIILIFGLLYSIMTMSQQISSDLPNIIQPHPTISSLLSFTQTPVNSFTGVPNIALPIGNLSTQSKDIDLNISLKYHPASVKPELKSSDVGMGWNLFAGGSISIVRDRLFDYCSDQTHFDKKDDTYSYNFMGYSGRFKIIKENNVFKIIQLGETDLKIEFLMDSSVLNPVGIYFKEPIHFKAYDNKGYCYLFDIYDTKIGNFILSNCDSTISPHSPTQYIGFKYRPTFHLTKIFDNNNQLLISFNYNTEIRSTQLYNKLSSIDAVNFGKIEFSYSFLEPKPDDYPDDEYQLNEILIKDKRQNLIKKFTLHYNTYTVLKPKRILTEIKEFDKNSIGFISTKLYYHNSTTIPYSLECQSQMDMGVDCFGYSNLKYINQPIRYKGLDNEITYDFSANQIEPAALTLGSLSQISYPTGRSILYEFEANTLSYDQNDYPSSNPLDAIFYFNLNNDFFTNTSNRYNEAINTFQTTDYNTVNTRSFTFTVTGTEEKSLYFNFEHEPYFSQANVDPNEPLVPTYTMTGPAGYYHNFSYGNWYSGVDNFHPCYGNRLRLQPGSYTINIGIMPGSNTTGSILINEKVPVYPLKEYVYGEGMRIKRIAHYNDANIHHFYDSTTPVQTISYDYSDFNNPARSSGRNYRFYRAINDNSQYFALNDSEIPVYYHNIKITNSNGNGYTKETYYNYHDFLPSNLSNIDLLSSLKYFSYKNGLLAKREVFDLAHKKFSEENLNYDFELDNNNLCWSKLTSKTSKNYFYPNGGTIANIVQTDETYSYNPLNKQIASQTSTNSTTGEILKSDFTYHTGNSIYSQNRIAEIEKVETFRNSELLSNSKVNYSNSFANNVSFLPQTIEVQKGSNAPSTKVKYNSYDIFGNVLEVENEIGVKTAYIYGYNQTQPIAKIENATYASIQSQVDNLQTLSNSSPEADLITALNTLRNSLPNNAMVTTYTYKPLIGISTVTDPNGFKTTYEYDDFNRLKKVKDKDGNTLSENEYNYRPN